MQALVVYVPETHLAQVKQAMFAAGAGKIGNYDQCCWQVKGQGQFRPLEGSAPFCGEKYAVSTEVEYRVEMTCADDCVPAVIAAMQLVHPYEEPAWCAWPVRSIL